MIDDLNFILGLMAQNTDALGFIPSTRLENYYVARNLYAIQQDLRGRRVGYLVHGALRASYPLRITQACVEYDRRWLGHGVAMVNDVIARAHDRYCSEVVLRCADDLAANAFWLALGFRRLRTEYPKNRRKRAINVYVYPILPKLFET